MEKIINSYIKTYLVGPMEKTKASDSGKGWRDKLRPELECLIDRNNNPLYVFDPTAEEQNKVGMDTAPFHKKLMGWIASGNNQKVAEYTDLIWRGKHSIEIDEKGNTKLVSILGDCDYVMNSNFLILRMEEGDSPCGTFGEAYEAFKHHIPIYVLQTMARDKYPVTLIGWIFASGGAFFENQTQLIEFIKDKYNLTVQR